MIVITRLRAWFSSVGLDTGRGAESRAIERRDARFAAARYSRGNIPLQHGAFITPSDLEDERKNAQYSFRE